MTRKHVIHRTVRDGVSEETQSSSDTDSLVRWVSEKVLESYRNGLTAGKKGETVGRQGASRRRGSFGKAQ